MRLNILTVDDSKGLRLVVRKALSSFDCTANEAKDGFDAFFAIERVRPDLILLDVNMPIMEGIETLERLKAAPELAAIPVIMLASPADHVVIPKLVPMGARAVLMKPFNEAALLEKIQCVLELKPAKAKSG